MFHCGLSKKPLAVILHFKITLGLFLILFLGNLFSDQTRGTTLSCFFVKLSSDHLLALISIKDWTLYEDMQRRLPYLLPDPSRGNNCGTELRKLNWPSTHIISATPELVYLYVSVESWLAGSRDSCYAERNVNRVPGGAGMWAWVKRTQSISDQLM